MEILLRSYVEVHKAIELLFGLMSGVGLDICVLDGRSHAPMGRDGFGGFRPHWLVWHIVLTEMYSTHA